MPFIGLAMVLTLVAPGPVAAESAPRIRLDADFQLTTSGDLPRPPLPGETHEVRLTQNPASWEWQVSRRGQAGAGSETFDDGRTASFVVEFPRRGAVTLHWSNGSHAQPNDFEPRVTDLAANKPFTIESIGGRSSDGAMPFFNVAGEGGGLVLAIGWSGDWSASFTVDDDGRLHYSAGLKQAHFRLPEGETIRLPAVLAMPYKGDWLTGQNQFRRLLLRHFTPRNHAPLELMPVAASVHGMYAFNDTTEANLSALARDIAALKLLLDTYWLDAGWNTGGFPAGQGNPEADAARFPHDLAPVGQAANDAHLRFLMWFEPERAMRGTWLDKTHPDWLLSPSATPDDRRYQENDGFRLLNLGKPEARDWTIGHVGDQIAKDHIAIYRQDFNLYPADYWHTNEPADQAGLTEIRHINGLYTFYDALLARFPGLIIDNCASGGRRINYELLRRSVLLWRSDSTWGEPAYPRNAQAMTAGLSLWLPLQGLGSVATDDVSLRSGMGACAAFAINYRDEAQVAALRSHLNRYLPLRRLYLEDYYPLTPYSTDPGQWIAFQFHDPATGEGVIQAFHGPGGGTDALTVHPLGLDKGRPYVTDDWDTPGPVRSADLSSQGLTFSPAPGSGRAYVVTYRPEP